MADGGAVPFEEDEKDPSVWFLDHNYIEGMNDMFKKVNAREKLIGWYHSGPKLRASDLEINELFKRYTPHPLLVIIDVQPKDVGVPTDAYFAVEEIKDVSIESRNRMETWLINLGRHNNIKDLRTHAEYHRSRRSRGNWCRASPARHPRRRSWHAIHTNHIATTVSARPAPATARHRPLPPESPRWRSARQPRDPRQPPRRIQPSTQPQHA